VLDRRSRRRLAPRPQADGGAAGTSELHFNELVDQPAPSAATPPTNDKVVVIPYAFTVDCGPYGIAFSNVVQGVETDRFHTYYDADGSPVRVVDQGGFVETDTNSITGKTLPFRQDWVETFDLLAGTRTVVGKALLMTDPGHGVVIRDTGRVVFDAPEHVVFESGPNHEVLHGDLDQLACTALATT
jgi:hypothetical protein